MRIPDSGMSLSQPSTQPSYTGPTAGAYWLTTVLLVCANIFSAPIGAQQSSPSATAPRQFEVAALKESAPDQRGTSWDGRSDRITIRNYTLRHLIRVAYDLKSDLQILGGPEWIDKSHFDISAKLDDVDAASLYKMPYEDSHRQILLMVQALLGERFQLKLKQDQRTLPVYSLVIAKSGAKIIPIPEPKDPTEAKNRNHGTNLSNGHLVAKAISMDRFADYLTEWTETGDRVVINRTGLNGEFDFTLNWTQDWGNGIPSDAPFPGLVTALQEQMGLTLKSDKSPVPVVEIESASKPQVD